ncbi:hypothetical protein MIR68_005269 [Amoeboaphelidium protococcarum]|nr:hypothetical protein MIR68_005269 [Amoeboaphelidium protococcarum]
MAQMRGFDFKKTMREGGWTRLGASPHSDKFNEGFDTLADDDDIQSLEHVLTGGPCGGKSIAQKLLAELFEGMGWKVYRVPEAATVMLSGGVLFSDLNQDQAYHFQKDLLKVMLCIEQTYFNLASSLAACGQKCLVVCDRGAMDCSAYIDRESWLKMVAELGEDELNLRDGRYDHVVHLVSAADGAEQYYNVSNNNVRSEGIDLARKLDKLCQAAWKQHPHYEIIDNSTGFTKKCERVVDHLTSQLGIPSDQYSTVQQSTLSNKQLPLSKQQVQQN